MRITLETVCADVRRTAAHREIMQWSTTSSGAVAPARARARALTPWVRERRRGGQQPVDPGDEPLSCAPGHGQSRTRSGAPLSVKHCTSLLHSSSCLNLSAWQARSAFRIAGTGVARLEATRIAELRQGDVVIAAHVVAVDRCSPSEAPTAAPRCAVLLAVALEEGPLVDGAGEIVLLFARIVGVGDVGVAVKLVPGEKAAGGAAAGGRDDEMVSPTAKLPFLSGVQARSSGSEQPSPFAAIVLSQSTCLPEVTHPSGPLQVISVYLPSRQKRPVRGSSQSGLAPGGHRPPGLALHEVVNANPKTRRTR